MANIITKQAGTTAKLSWKINNLSSGDKAFAQIAAAKDALPGQRPYPDDRSPDRQMEQLAVDQTGQAVLEISAKNPGKYLITVTVWNAKGKIIAHPDGIVLVVECPYCVFNWNFRDVKIHIIDRFPPNTNHGFDSGVTWDQSVKDGISDYLKQWFGAMMGWPETDQPLPRAAEQIHATWLANLEQAKKRVDVQWHDWQSGAAPAVADTDLYIYMCMFGATQALRARFANHRGYTWMTAAERQTATTATGGREMGVAMTRGQPNQRRFFCEVWPDQLEELNHPSPNSIADWLGPVILHELFHLKIDVHPVPLAGTISVAASGTDVTGSGTSFQSSIWDTDADELSFPDGAHTFGRISSVTDDTTLTLQTPSLRAENNIAVAVLHDNHHWGTKIAAPTVGRSTEPSRIEMARMLAHLDVHRPIFHR